MNVDSTDVLKQQAHLTNVSVGYLSQMQTAVLLDSTEKLRTSENGGLGVYSGQDGICRPMYQIVGNIFA